MISPRPYVFVLPVLLLVTVCSSGSAFFSNDAGGASLDATPRAHALSNSPSPHFAPYDRPRNATDNQDALLPQQFAYQVTLYDWLETITVSDVRLPTSSITWDGFSGTNDQLADLWLQVKGLTASSVVRGAPDWYVLDAGNGRGIEATGEVRFWFEPKGNGGYHGNPPRSWSNEPAFLYQLDIPLSGGGQGNPYFQNPALGRRAIIVAMVDMMMHHRGWLAGERSGGYHHFGKAALAWAETYRWAKDVLPSDVRDAFEAGLGHALDRMIEMGPVGINTNMDMFAVQAQAEIYMATDDSQLKAKAVDAARRALFGYTDGRLGEKHKVFRRAGYDGGVFDPSGFIMEGGQPDIFYGGESIYHLAGALSAVMDHETGAVPSDWGFLMEVVRRLQEWRTYQSFFDPATASPNIDAPSDAPYYHAGSGMSGRTSYGVPHGQRGVVWKHLFLAGTFSEAHHRARNYVPDVAEMENEISDRFSYVNEQMSSTYTGTPPSWDGWSPWTKATPYLPPSGWYSSLKSLEETGDPGLHPPIHQQGVHFNKSFGGYPVGEQYWAYKDTDGTREWGFFLEGQARQGTYGGWYGGKIETFWTETTGVVLLNRHGKAGCGSDLEDSKCFDNLDVKAGQHVWGRDENGNGFTTLLIRGRDLARTSSFDIGGNPPRVQVTNYFNDPSHAPGQAGESGEETGSEIQGQLEVVNRFEALTDGVRVTHKIDSDQADEVTELWASIPVFLRLYNPLRAGVDPQINLENTTIEYWSGTSWETMPEDLNSDGVPELVTTTALRLGRDFEQGAGPQYAYVELKESRDVRLSKGIYRDPYQSKSSVRTVHIDLHGDPGTVKTIPSSETVSYTLQTTDPTQSSGGSRGVMQHDISLQQGWNLVSTYLSPSDPDLEAVFSELDADISVVRDENRLMYSPDDGVNQIGAWESDEAYKIRAERNVTLTIEGQLLDRTTTSISLDKGWNFVPYVAETSQPVDRAFSPVSSELIMVRDEQGNVYYPLYNVDDIGTVEPGEGYEVFVNQSTTLTYPSP